MDCSFSDLITLWGVYNVRFLVLILFPFLLCHSYPKLLITKHSNAVILFCASPLPCFGVGVSETFHIPCVHIISVRFGLLSSHHLGNNYSLG